MERRVEKPSDSEKDMIVKVKKSVVFEGEKKRIKKKKKKREENPKARRGGGSAWQLWSCRAVPTSAESLLNVSFLQELKPEIDLSTASIIAHCRAGLGLNSSDNTTNNK